MNNVNVIDRFLDTFIRYIDSGFGLLAGEVAFLTSILVAIDITLAGLAWAMDEGSNVIARLLAKVLYIGVFALILNNWAAFSVLIFQSFSGLGLEATNNNLTPQDLLRPGYVAGTGFAAAHPLMEQAGSLLGFTTFFDNAVTILVLVFAWLVVVLAFFILAVQLFITIIEFKLTTLAGFVLVPFALWGKTAFLAERVLGNVFASGIKVMVLAVIIGIGTTLFNEFTTALNAQEPDLEQAMTLVLAAIALFGLGIFGPSIATGLVSGAPQLGAGAAVGTVGAIAAGTMAAGSVAVGAARAGASAVSAVRAGAMIPNTGSPNQSAPDAPAGGSSPATASSPTASATPVRPAAQQGATSGARSLPAAGSSTSTAGGGGAPTWARRLRAEQRWQRRVHTVEQAVKEGDRPGASANPDLKEER
ncbi:MAG: P-type conjugative transfer protein TrbL [Alphaproteobacteria bacterium]|nr:P-type conjugative transfer protein TrbL [Alphaproteobacteria bacterium]